MLKYWNKFKNWAEADVTVNCAWYYLLLLVVVGGIVMDTITWLI